MITILMVVALGLKILTLVFVIGIGIEMRSYWREQQAQRRRRQKLSSKYLPRLRKLEADKQKLEAMRVALERGVGYARHE